MTSAQRPVRIRAMRLADIDRVMGIASSLPGAPRWAREMYVNAIGPGSTPPRLAMVAEAPDEAVVGFAVIGLIPPQAELETIAVAAGAQRRGIASQIVGFLLEELKRRQITEVTLEVRESNRGAQGLYRSLGFVEAGRRRAYYADPPEDALLLRRLVFGADAGQIPSCGQVPE